MYLNRPISSGTGFHLRLFPTSGRLDLLSVTPRSGAWTHVMLVSGIATDLLRTGLVSGIDINILLNAPGVNYVTTAATFLQFS